MAKKEPNPARYKVTHIHPEFATEEERLKNEKEVLYRFAMVHYRQQQERLKKAAK